MNSTIPRHPSRTASSFTGSVVMGAGGCAMRSFGRLRIARSFNLTSRR